MAQLNMLSGALRASIAQPVQPTEGCASDVANSSEFIQRTNAEYSEWCKTYYQADALDDRGMVSLHGLWAWQEQARRKICAATAQPVQPAFPKFEIKYRFCGDEYVSLNDVRSAWPQPVQPATDDIKDVK